MVSFVPRLIFHTGLLFLKVRSGFMFKQSSRTIGTKNRKFVVMINVRTMVDIYFFCKYDDSVKLQVWLFYNHSIFDVCK